MTLNMKFPGALTLIMTAIHLFGAVPEQVMADAVKDYYMSALNVPAEDLQMRFVHFPDTRRLPDADYSVTVEERGLFPGLGHQTLRILVWEKGRILKKYTLSVDVSVYMDVLVTSQAARRNSPLNADNTEMRRLLLNRQAGRVFTDLSEADGMHFARSVQAGQLILDSYLKAPADVYYGDEVEIRLNNGVLTLTAEGRVLQEARIGDEVAVQMQVSGKRMTGTLIENGLVEINM